ncbi:SAM-dependent DNA methyltransferase, partial [Salmonella enterica]|nr:SAM-dependent DNA methyltransferase [Salmonella enterica]
MVIALAQEMQDAGINYQQHLHVTAIDVDPRAVHMAYVQFSLMHIPAVVIVGNSLTLEEREHWYTPAHVLGGWNMKLARRGAEDARQAIEARPASPEPVATPAP